MSLYLVKDLDRWGFSLNVVRANSEEEAKGLVSPQSKRMQVTPLPNDGPPGILWCHDESPDTPR